MPELPVPPQPPQPRPDPDGRPGPHDPPGPRPKPGDPAPEIPDHLRPPRREADGPELPPNLRYSENLGMLAWFPEESVRRQRAALVGVHGFRREGGGSLR